MTLKRFGQQVHVTAGIEPVSLERTAWDLAVTTGALAYIDPQLAFALSHLYTGQQGITDQQRMIVQSAIYGRSWDTDFYGTMRSISFYFNDIRILEPALLGQYDDVLPRIDRALDEPAAQSTNPQ